MVDSTDIQTSVYRYYDKQGLLLYVGITERGIKRNREHRKMPRKTFMTQLRLSLTAPDANGKYAVKRAQLIYSARS